MTVSRTPTADRTDSRLKAVAEFLISQLGEEDQVSKWLRYYIIGALERGGDRTRLHGPNGALTEKAKSGLTIILQHQLLKGEETPGEVARATQGVQRMINEFSGRVGLLLYRQIDIVPRQIGKYPVVKELGRGGMGVVYLGTHPDLDDALLAIKVKEIQEADDEERAGIREQVRNEASIGHSLTGKGRCIQVKDAFDADGMPVIVTEYVDGMDGKDCLKHPMFSTLETPGVLSPLAALLLAEQMVRCLQDLHTHDKGEIVHRDVKPENFMMLTRPIQELEQVWGKNGKITNVEVEAVFKKYQRNIWVKIGDFGIAQQNRKLTADPTATLDALQERTNMTMDMKQRTPQGTPPYMAPEAISGSSLISTRTDIFSLGLVLYTLITGQNAAEARKHAEGVDLSRYAGNPWGYLDALRDPPQESAFAVSRSHDPHLEQYKDGEKVLPFFDRLLRLLEKMTRRNRTSRISSAEALREIQELITWYSPEAIAAREVEAIAKAEQERAEQERLEQEERQREAADAERAQRAEEAKRALAQTEEAQAARQHKTNVALGIAGAVGLTLAAVGGTYFATRPTGTPQSGTSTPTTGPTTPSQPATPVEDAEAVKLTEQSARAALAKQRQEMLKLKKRSLIESAATTGMLNMNATADADLLEVVDYVFAAIAQDARMGSIETIDLTGIPMTAERIKALFDSETLKPQAVSMVNCQVGDAELAAFCASKAAENLMELQLPNNNITDVGVGTLRVSPFNGTLTTLNVKGNQGISATGKSTLKTVVSEFGVLQTD